MAFDPSALRALPPIVDAILTEERATPRLRAHLTLVHDVAVRLSDAVHNTWPALDFDAEAITFGAATHDIGKVRLPAELSLPGKAHEALGERMLLERGVPARFARFARSHGDDVMGLPLEDLLVIAADTAWKGKRNRELDESLGAAIARATKQEPWEVFLRLDEILGALASDADARLLWQGEHSAT